jgi:hypothetical protein
MPVTRQQTTASRDKYTFTLSFQELDNLQQVEDLVANNSAINLVNGLITC